MSAAPMIRAIRPMSSGTSHNHHQHHHFLQPPELDDELLNEDEIKLLVELSVEPDDEDAADSLLDDVLPIEDELSELAEDVEEALVPEDELDSPALDDELAGGGPSCRQSARPKPGWVESTIVPQAISRPRPAQLGACGL